MYNKGKCHMKFIKRANMWKNSTGSCTLKLGKERQDLEAHSYNWWCFAKYINGVLVFNNYTYSVSTTAHQSRVRMMLSDLGHEIGLYIESPRGLDDLESSLKYYSMKIEEYEEHLKKPRIRQTTKDNLKLKIESAKYTMRRIIEVGQLDWMTCIKHYKEVSNEN